MISMTEFKKMMNRNGKNYSDEQLIKIREFFYQLAEIEYTHYIEKVLPKLLMDEEAYNGIGC
jgi:hypothetical protein